MKSTKANWIFIISSILLIVVVTGFTGGLNIASFKKSYSESLVASYAVSGGETVRKIEYAVKYGKPITNFYGIEDLLSKKKNDHPELATVSVALPDGRLLYGPGGAVSNVSLGTGLAEQSTFAEDDHSIYRSVKEDGVYYVFLPLHDRNQTWIGNLVINFDEHLIDRETGVYLRKMIVYLAILAALSFLLLGLYLYKAPIQDAEGRIRQKPFLIGLLLILSVAQILFGYLNFRMFEQAYRDVAGKNIELTAQLIGRDIESVVDKGVPYDKLFGIEDYLKGIARTVPFIDNIAVAASDGSIRYGTNQTDAAAAQAAGSDEWNVLRALKPDPNGMAALLHVEVSKSYIASKIKQILLDMGTVWMTSFIFMVEITLFTLLILGRKMGRKRAQADEQALMANGVEIVRPIAFLLFTAVFMSTSFIPMAMKQVYEPIFGLSEQVTLGLPISLEMMCAGLSTLLTGYSLERIGWKPIFTIGLLLFAAGTALSGWTNDALVFIGARGLTGFGYGFSLMSLRGYINASQDEQQRTNGLSGLFAGLYAGVNCGVIVGAMLADRIGFQNVFYTALSVVIGAGTIGFLITRNAGIVRKRTRTALQPRLKPSLLRFVANRKVLTFFAFILIPTVVCSMFLDYYFPVYANENGISTSDVGRAFLMHGIIIVYLGPVLTKWTSRLLGIGKSVLLSVIIVIAAMLVFAYFGTLAAAFIAVVLLGIADSFGLVAQNNYYTGLRATQTIGTGKALGYYDNMRKTAQMLGPLVFGTAALYGFQGVGWVGIAVLATLLIFLATNLSILRKDLR